MVGIVMVTWPDVTYTQAPRRSKCTKLDKLSDVRVLFEPNAVAKANATGDPKLFDRKLSVFIERLLRNMDVSGSTAESLRSHAAISR